MFLLCSCVGRAGFDRFSQEMAGADVVGDSAAMTGGDSSGAPLDEGLSPGDSAGDPVGIDHFRVTGIRSASVVGVAETVAVEARDAADAVVTGYAGTVTFTSSDSAAALPAPHAFVATDAGIHTFSRGVTFAAVGTQVVTASDGMATGSQTDIEVYAASGGYLIWAVDGDQALELLGESVASAGDFDHDGFADVIIGSPAYLGTAGSGAGRCSVYSGADGSVLFSREGERIGDSLGDSVASAGDYNNDGHDDVVVGARGYDGVGGADTGKIYIHSGADGAVLFAVEGELPGEFGHSAFGLGDFDDDGYHDVVVGAWGYDGGAGTDSGKAYVFSGHDNSLLFSREGEVAGDMLGRSVSGAGDFDGDGFDDIVVSSRGFDGVAGAGAGKIYVYSGADGSQVFAIEGEAAGCNFGSSVANAGDFDADGRADIIVGAYLFAGAAGAQSGKVYVFSGRDHALLLAREGDTAGDRFGDTVAPAGDYDGDGVVDVVVGAETFSGSTGKISVLSGITGRVLFEQEGESAGDTFGHSVATAGDMDGDGRAEIIVGAPAHDGSRGRAYVYGITP